MPTSMVSFGVAARSSRGRKAVITEAVSAWNGHRCGVKAGLGFTGLGIQDDKHHASMTWRLHEPAVDDQRLNRA